MIVISVMRIQKQTNSINLIIIFAFRELLHSLPIPNDHIETTKTMYSATIISMVEKACFKYSTYAAHIAGTKRPIVQNSTLRDSLRLSKFSTVIATVIQRNPWVLYI